MMSQFTMEILSVFCFLLFKLSKCQDALPTNMDAVKTGPIQPISSFKHYVFVSPDGNFRIRDLIPSFSNRQEQKISNGIIVNDGRRHGKLIQAPFSGESPILLIEEQPADQIADSQVRIEHQRRLLKPIPLSRFDSTQSSDDLLRNAKQVDDSQEFISLSELSDKGIFNQRGDSNKDSLFLIVDKDISKESFENVQDDPLLFKIPSEVSPPHQILTPPKHFQENTPKNLIPLKHVSSELDSYEVSQLAELNPGKQLGFSDRPEYQTRQTLLKPLHKSEQLESRILTPFRERPHETPQYHDSPSHTHEYQARDDSSANYRFGYKVTGNEGDAHGRYEERNGRRVDGMYHVDLPNGYRQIVKYYADETGYHPTITYEKIVKEDSVAADGKQQRRSSLLNPHIHEHTHIHSHPNGGKNHPIQFTDSEESFESKTGGLFSPSSSLDLPSIEDRNPKEEAVTSETKTLLSRPVFAHQSRPEFGQRISRFNEPAFFIFDSRKRH